MGPHHYSPRAVDDAHFEQVAMQLFGLLPTPDEVELEPYTEYDLAWLASCRIKG